MKKRPWLGAALSGAAAGLLNGFFGGTGGTVLVPLLEKTTPLPQSCLFSGALQIMLPICLMSLCLSPVPIPWQASLPYLAGSLAGGMLSVLWGKKVQSIWLHRGLGLLILTGGVRLLWNF